jgi:putative NADH-flavin reductase
MKIAVIGITGMTGGPLADELLARGHQVTGISRNAAKAPARPDLSLIAADVMDMNQLAGAIAGHEVVVSAYSPGHGMGPQIYKDCVEAAWRIKRVFKRVDCNYLILIGGASSLFVRPGIQMFEDSRWPEWYFDTASPDHLRYLGDITGVALFRQVADARERPNEPPESQSDAEDAEQRLRKFLKENMACGPDIAQGCRAQFELFQGDTSFRWSFVSPPWFYRPGPRTGRYRTVVGDLPMAGDKPASIFVPDLALAIADEVERQLFVHQHWSAANVTPESAV